MRIYEIQYLWCSLLTLYCFYSYRVLKEYIKEEDESLYKSLETQDSFKAIDTKMDTAANVSKKPQTNSNHRNVYKKEVFYTAEIVLVVKKDGRCMFLD